uniref:Daxx histone-binding domain-containing protein n=1 Tax=Anopheles epiroticus TaxID=199890 RepID=A0A182PZ18_9DIPT
MASAPSVIVLDSDSDDGKRKAPVTSATATVSPTVAMAKPNGVNGPVGSSSIPPCRTAAGGETAVQEPPRKRIKPITIASNLQAEAQWSMLHNNNNNDGGQPIIVRSENFAPITYSEDWEQEIKRYHQKLAVAGGAVEADGSKRERSESVQGTPASSRSSTAEDTDLNTSGSTPVGQSEKRPAGKKFTSSVSIEKNPIGKEFQELLDACRKADGSKDMETLIERKLVRYYEIVHPDYINSKSFKKAVVQVTAEVRAQPNLVFLKLANIVEELSARRKSRSVAAAPASKGKDNPTASTTAISTTATSTGSSSSNLGEQGKSDGAAAAAVSKKDQQITRLNRTLYVLMKRIRQMEEADVDFNHETNSTYVMAERYKKRAFEVYEKLCDITGESKNAHRLVRKPIHFQGTQYAEFNRTLSQFVNRTNTFPNFRDVLKCLQHCNIKNDYGLSAERMNRIAQDAFIKVGKQLQKRRKTDLYETVMYHAGEEKDPASVDPKLREKLEENGKHYSKVNKIIDKYAEKELTNREEEQEKKHKLEKESSISSTAEETSSTSIPSSSKASATVTGNTETTSSKDTAEANGELETTVLHDTEDEDDDDDDDDDEEDEEDDEDDEFESTTKENVRPDTFEDVVISDDDELIVLDS